MIEELSASRDAEVAKLQGDLAELRKSYEKMEAEKNAEITRAVNSKTVG